jgi:hypothetical protein
MTLTPKNERKERKGKKKKIKVNKKERKKAISQTSHLVAHLVS